MVLTDTDILKQIRAGNIEIEPFDKKRLGSNSYDVTLGKDLLVYTEDTLDCIKMPIVHRFEIPEEGYVLHPGELYLGVTNERTRSKCFVPDIDGKSSIGRLGICIHQTAGIGDIGFNGHWTLEITVIKPIRVYANMPIGQVRFMLPLSDCTVSYALKDNAKYRNQPGIPIPSQMWKNFIIEKPLYDTKIHSK